MNFFVMKFHKGRIYGLKRTALFRIDLQTRLAAAA